MVFYKTVVAVAGDLGALVFVGEEIVDLFKEIVFAFVAYVFVSVFKDVCETGLIIGKKKSAAADYLKAAEGDAGVDASKSDV